MLSHIEVFIHLSCNSLSRNNFAPGEEFLYFRVLSFSQHPVRVTLGNHCAGFRIKKDGIVANGKNTGQLMSHYYYCCSQAVTQLKDQIIKITERLNAAPGKDKQRLEQELENLNMRINTYLVF